MAVEVGSLILDPFQRVRGTLCSSTETFTKINKCSSTDLAITFHQKCLRIWLRWALFFERELLDSKINLNVKSGLRDVLLLTTLTK